LHAIHQNHSDIDFELLSQIFRSDRDTNSQSTALAGVTSEQGITSDQNSAYQPQSLDDLVRQRNLLDSIRYSLPGPFSAAQAIDQRPQHRQQQQEQQQQQQHEQPLQAQFQQFEQQLIQLQMQHNQQQQQPPSQPGYDIL
jgi:hypothetical protein